MEFDPKEWRAHLSAMTNAVDDPSMCFAIRDGARAELRELAELSGTRAEALARIAFATRLTPDATPEEIANKAVPLLEDHPWFLKPQELDAKDWRRYLASSVRDERVVACILEGIATEIGDARQAVPPQIQAGSLEEALHALNRVRMSVSMAPWAAPCDIATEAERRAMDVGAAMREVRETLQARPGPDGDPAVFVEWLEGRTTPQQRDHLVARLQAGVHRDIGAPEVRLYRFHSYCGRMGDLDGLFAVDRYGEQCLQALVASERPVYFGEVLGKHSEIEVVVRKEDLRPVEATPEAILLALQVIGCTFEGPVTIIEGFCPLECEGTCEVEDARLLDWARGVPVEELDEVVVDAD